MSIQANFIRMLFKHASFIRTEPSDRNLAQKRVNFERIGKWMKPDNGTIVSRSILAGVAVDQIENSKNVQRTILYAHGGGFVYGTNKVHLHMLSLLSKYADARIVAIDYSFVPEHKYPTALDEAYRVYLELIKQNDHIIIAGDSAGGNLTLCLAIKLRDEGCTPPQKVILLSPSTDATFTNKWYEINAANDLMISKLKLEYFLGSYIPEGFDPKDKRISPLYANLDNLPPTHIHVGSDEVMYGDSYLVHKKIIESGGVSELYVGESMWHVWHLFSRYIPEARSALRQIADFIKA